MMNCHELALKLSNNYYTTPIFNETYEGLGEYLNHNGILLTMCLGQTILPSIFGGPCKLGIQSKHISASWIRNVDTGFRVFGSQLPIGLILDPTIADIKCIYPIDAVTDTRLNSGCGLPLDAPGAPNSFYRILERFQIIKYKNDAFGKDVKWSDIDCKDFLGMADDDGFVAVNNSDCSLATEQDTSLLLESEAKYMFETWSNLLGHPVCNPTNAWPEPSNSTTDTILYGGSCVWKPSEWLSMVDAMVKFTLEYPNANIWNELVIAKPWVENDIVQAVFLMDGSYDQSEYEAAKMESRRLGKPLLILDPPTKFSYLTFTCEPSIATHFLRKMAEE